MPVSPPRPRLPPLNALRAFEASARLGGFSAAARELNVTQGAVAQQIRQLEEWAGAQLFHRHARGVRLSAAGRSAMPALTDAFDLVGAASQALRRHGAPGEVRIATLPSIAQLWLSPRLPNVRAASPGAAISVTALETRPNLDREPFDLAIFFVDHSEIQEGMINLGRDVIYPVCSPLLAESLNNIEDLAGQVFLHDSTWKDDWQAWLDATSGNAEIEPAGPAYSLFALAVEEARNGAGILIGHDALVAPLVANGALAAPFPQRVSLERNMVLEAAAGVRGKQVVEQVITSLQMP